MKSTAAWEKGYLTTPKELNVKLLIDTLHIQFLRNCECICCSPVDEIYGYSYLIPSELWVSYFGFAP